MLSAQSSMELRPGPRHLPGIGASRTPELLSLEEIDDVIHVSDLESVQGCRELALKMSLPATALLTVSGWGTSLSFIL